MNARYKVRRGGRRAVAKEVVLQPRPGPSMCEIPFAQKLLAICFTLLGVQLEALPLDVLFGGELGTVSVDVSNDPSVRESDKGIVDNVTR